MNYIIIGPQASGKGTQANLLAEKLRIKHISTGDILRAEKKSGSKLGNKLKAYMEKGLLVPDKIIDEVVDKVLKDNPGGIIFDGYPRDEEQAKHLDKITKIKKVIFLEVPDDVSISRISGRRICTKCGKDYHIIFKPSKKEGICDDCNVKLIQRADDKPEAIKVRLATYHKQTEPLLEHYDKKVMRINGDQSIQGVKEDIFEKLKLKLK